MMNRSAQHLLLLVLICSSISIQAQVLNISNETMQYNNAERSALKISIAPNAKEVKKEFKDYMNDEHDVKIEGIGFFKNKDVLYTEKQLIPAIAPQQMKLFAKVIETGEQTEMYVFGELDNNIQITPSTTYAAYNGMKDITISFLNTLLPDYYEEIVEEQTDVVEELEDDKEDMRKKIAKNKEKIKDLTEENKALEQQLDETEQQLDENKDELGTKKDNLKEVNNKLKTNKVNNN